MSLLFILPILLFREMIVDIDVEGTNRVSQSMVISVSCLEIGDELQAKSIKEAIIRLFSTGFFEDVQIEKEKEGGGCRLIIHVEEAPVVSSIEFIGNKKFKSKKLKEMIKLKDGDFAPSKKIFESANKIKEEYEKEGFYFTSVDPKIEDVGDKKIKIKYVIDEGCKAKIRKIDIVGNKFFSDKKIKKRLKNKQKYWMPFSGKFNKEEFEKDLDRIIKFYNNNGYPNCKIKDVKITPYNKWVDITIEIDEGKKFYFGNVQFSGNKAYDSTILMREVKFKKYSPYSQDKIKTTLQNIYGIYSDIGYLYANIEPVEEILDSIVNINFEIYEGRIAHINRIVIANNLKTHEKVIRRELTIFPGEIFSRKKLIASQRKIFNLGFFKNISLDTKQVNELGDIDLIINVEEKEAGQASIGASYYPRYGFVGNLSLNTPNFRGLGERVYINLEKGAKLETMQIGYEKPWLFDTPLSLGGTLYHTLQYRPHYNVQKTGGNISTSRTIPRLLYTKGHLSYTLEKVKIKVDDPAKVGKYIRDRIGKELRSMIGFSIVRDSRDNFLNPTTGTRNSIDIELSGGLLGGNVNYHKEIFETSTYHRLLWKFVIGMRAKFGIVNKTVPIYERFVLGGIGSWGLRGYRDWSIGPIEEKEVIGGRFSAIFTIENKLVLTQENIYPLMFIDLGNAWRSINTANLQDLKKGVGVGLRIEIPMMGLVGVDLGYRLDPTFLQPNRGWEFHFQMGRLF